MESDDIAEIRIDGAGRLCVVPERADFAYIYRAAMEVHWDEQGKFLYSPPPKEWSYVQWFQQIIAAAKDEYGCFLSITPRTQWRSVKPDLKEAILLSVAAARA